VVSFSVLMVDFANRILAEAARKMSARFRATPLPKPLHPAASILMTGLAAVLGLTPMHFLARQHPTRARCRRWNSGRACSRALRRSGALRLFKREKASLFHEEILRCRVDCRCAGAQNGCDWFQGMQNPGSLANHSSKTRRDCSPRHAPET